MCIRSCSVIYKLAVIVVVPSTEVNGTVSCLNAGHIGINTTIGACNVLVYHTHKHACITVCIVLIVTCNVIVYVELCTNVAVLKANTGVLGIARRALSTGGIVCTNDTAAGYVIGTPKSRNLVGVINCNVSKCNLSVDCFSLVPTNYTNDTTVTDVVNAGIRIDNRDVLKESAVVCISSNATGCSNLTVAREVLYSKVSDSTAINFTEQTHTIAVVLKRSIVPVVVALHLPGVLIEVSDGASVTIEGTLEVTETGGDSYTRSLICTLVVIITDGIEYKTVFGSIVIIIVSITNIDVGKECYGLACKGITNNFIGVSVLIYIFIYLCYTGYLIHTANDATKCCKLVCVSNIELGCIRIIPRIVELAAPSILCISYKSNYREGCKIKNYVTCSRIISKAVVCRSLAVLKKSHSYSLTILNVVNGVVTKVKTLRKSLGKSDSHRNSVVLGYTGDMYVNSADLLVLSDSNVSYTCICAVNSERKLVVALCKLNACRNGSKHALALDGSLICNLAICVNIYDGG